MKIQAPLRSGLLLVLAGVLVLAGEGSGFTSGYGAVYADLHPALGLSSVWQTLPLDPGCTQFATPGAPHYLNAGVNQLAYAYGTDVTMAPGAATVLIGVSGQVLVGEEQGVIFVTDTQPMSGSCGNLGDNLVWYRNLYGGGLPPDSDGDGVGDYCDICPGGDDTVDVDVDAIPDDCDSCPAGDNSLDSDGDGVPDGCDICPGFSDFDDADADRVPDGCDQCPGFDDSIDTDGDGAIDGCDICPGFNDTQDAG